MTVTPTVPARPLPWLELVVLGAATVWLAIGGGHGGAAATVVRAVAGGGVLAAVVVAARQLVPREPVGGAIAAIVLAIAPPFRDAIARDAASTALAGAAVGCMIAIGCMRAGDRRRAGAIGGAALVLIAIALTGVLGPVPTFVPGLAAIVGDTGRGAATIVVAAGLLGAGFGALTDLRGARAVLVAIAVAAIAGVGAPLLAVLAIGAAIVPAAVVRAAASDAIGLRRHLITAAAGLPLIAGSAITGAALDAASAAVPPITATTPPAR